MSGLGPGLSDTCPTLKSQLLQPQASHILHLCLLRLSHTTWFSQGPHLRSSSGPYMYCWTRAMANRKRSPSFRDRSARGIGQSCEVSLRVRYTEKTGSQLWLQQRWLPGNDLLNSLGMDWHSATILPFHCLCHTSTDIRLPPRQPVPRRDILLLIRSCSCRRSASCLAVSMRSCVQRFPPGASTAASSMYVAVYS